MITRFFTTISLLSAICMASSQAQEQAAPTLFEAKSLTYTGGDYQDETFRYLLMKPDSIEEGKQYPLVLFLHGAGERGDDNRIQTAHFPNLFEDEAFRKRFPCYLIAPQCRKDRRWTQTSWEDTSSPSSKGPATAQMDVAIEALLTTLKEHPIDRSRLYLTGLSMGGYGSWDLAARKPNWFAAVAPVCGGGDTDLAHRIATTPVWAYHGDADNVVPVRRSRDMIAAIRKSGGLPRYTEVPGRGHDSWVPAYKDNNHQLLSWMFQQRRSSINDQAMPGAEALGSAHSPLEKGERIVFLGDSLTAAGVGPDGYISVLQQEIDKRRPDLDVHMIGAGIGGHKVPDIRARLDRDVLSFAPSVVFIFIGVNDVWHTEMGTGTSESDYENGLRDVIARSQKAGAQVILATPPLIGEKQRGQNEHDTQLDAYSAISRNVATRMGVTVCDLRIHLTDYLSVFNRDNNESGILTTDGVHFTKDGNRLVADHIAQSIFQALSSTR
ncbi:MAG: lysophospholipase L1-like esterase/poly(3-hydroxybutyrate) depolymerase [Verrucomicrobiales bacterium]|jgi:lysophospholipase L1-like esterase/poly(3-hydroxybutyrate) depolymerase